MVESTAVHIYYSDHHAVPLPPGHRFPMGKYARLRARLVDDAVVPAAWLAPAPLASRDELERVHDADYVAAVIDGRLDERAQRRIGLTWSPAMVTRSLASVGGTLAAARAALRDGLAGNLAGGTHHAHRGFGSGFCVWNDLAVTARWLLAERGVRRVLILDLDVHQGDGTATIFADEPRVFTCSMHGARNFPFHKATSDLDVELPDDTGDAAYLAALDAALDTVFTRARPELVIYLAGADPYAGDRLGRLALSIEGLQARDERVLGACRAAGVPVAVAMAGGYAQPIEDTVTVHFNTICTAARTMREA